MQGTRDAEPAHARACAVIDERRFGEALAPAAEVCRCYPDWADAWWNYAVALKHAGRWAECLEAADRTLAIQAEDASGAHWNAGIAATALGNWARARAAWSACGIEVPPGDGAIEMQLGAACVRVSPGHAPEVVVCERLDPCRARIASVPLPESMRRFGDVVLHDGEARGTRRLGQREVGVFDELLVLQPSPCGTWQVIATCDGPTDRDALLALFDDVDGAIEDWTELEFVCASCSAGEPHAHPEPAPRRAWRAERTLGLALRDERDLGRLRRLGRWWRRGVRDVARVR